MAARRTLFALVGTILGAFAAPIPSIVAAGTPPVLFATDRSAESVVTVTAPAEYLAIEVTLYSEEADWKVKFDSVTSMLTQLSQGAAARGFEVRINNAAGLTDSDRKFSFSSGGRWEACAEVTLLAPLPTKPDLVSTVRDMTLLLESIRCPKNASLRKGRYTLAIGEPERFRNELLRKIRAQIDISGKALLTKPNIRIDGIDVPIRARQNGADQIDLFLPFTTSYVGE